MIRSDDDDGIPQWWDLAPGTYTWKLELWHNSLGGGDGERVAQATITFYVKHQIMIYNDFGAGNINVDGELKQNGSSVLKFTGDNLALGAIDQTYDGYNRIWNENGTNSSEWQKKLKDEPNYLRIANGLPRNYNYTVASNDNGANIRDVLKKVCNISFQNSFGSGKIKVNGQEYNSPTADFPVVEANTISMEAVNNQPNQDGSIIYGFVNWNDGNSSISRTVSASVHFIYIANFSTIHTRGALTSNETWSGSINLTDDVTVPAGLSVTFRSGTSVNFNGHRIIVNGSVSGEGNINCIAIKQNGAVKALFDNNIQQAVNYAVYGQDIYLQSRPYSGNISFSGKSRISLIGSNSTINGSISITNSEIITISGLRMSHGPSINGGSSNSFMNSVVTGVTALSNYNCSISVTNITAENIEASFGIYSYAGSGGISFSRIKNGDCGIYLTGEGNWDIRNNTFCGNGYDVYVPSPAYAFITNNYSYSRSSPAAGNYTLEEELPLQNICGMRKESSTEEKNEINTDISPELKELDQRYLELMSSVLKDKEENKYDLKNYTKEYEELIKEYKKFLDDKNDKETIKSAIKQISNLYKDQENKQGLYNFINETTTSGKLKSMYPYFKRYLIWKAIDESDYEGALKLTDEILALKDVAEDLKPEMLYEKGLIYKYYLNDKEKSGVMFTLILKNYPKSELCKLAALEQGVDFSITIDKKKNNTQQSEIPNENVLGNAYPNPFNPTTVISYSLKKQGYITLTVFDVLGKEVARLVDGVQTEGQHRVNFNGIDLPSGIYVYQLKGSDFILNKKMQLIK